MVRARLATVAVAAGLGLLGGCSSLARLNPFGRHGETCPCDMGDFGVDGAVPTEGPILEGLPPAAVPAPPPGAVNGVPPPGAVNGVPPLAPPPNRVVPQPQAPTTPYVP